MDNGLGAANRLVDLALLQGGLFLALADDRGGILVANRASLAILWRRQVHSGAISRVLTVGRGDDEAILSVDSYGTCVLSDPASGRTLHSWRPSLCVHPEPHGHQVEPAWDGEHVVLSCLQSWPPGIAPMIDAGASVGVVVNVHDAGSPALLCDRWAANFATRRPLSCRSRWGARRGWPTCAPRITGSGCETCRPVTRSRFALTATNAAGTPSR